MLEVPFYEYGNKCGGGVLWGLLWMPTEAFPERFSIILYTQVFCFESTSVVLLVLALTREMETVYTHIDVSCQFQNHYILSTKACWMGFWLLFVHAAIYTHTHTHNYTHLMILAEVQQSTNSPCLGFPFRAGDGRKLDEKTETVHSNFLRSAPA